MGAVKMGPSRGKNSVGSTRPVHNVMVALALAATVWGQAGWSEPKRYDPDPQTCQADNIRKAFLANLLPQCYVISGKLYSSDKSPSSLEPINYFSCTKNR